MVTQVRVTIDGFIVISITKLSTPRCFLDWYLTALFSLRKWYNLVLNPEVSRTKVTGLSLILCCCFFFAVIFLSEEKEENGGGGKGEWGER